MKSGKNSQPTEEISEEIQENNTLSIDEFFKQLESKEKDLDISSELVFEIDEADIDEDGVPDFLKTGQLDFNAQDYEDLVANDESVHTTFSNDAAFPDLESKISTLQKQVAKLETERIELVKIARRRQVDFEGYKKRTERGRNEIFLNQLSSLATQMLPVIDNFNRALDSVSNLDGENVADLHNFFNGIILVNQQLNDVLSDMGVSPILSVGETFDPHFHEAVATEETDEIPPHTITAELLRGYRIGERVIRPSMVKVSVQVKIDK